MNGAIMVLERIDGELGTFRSMLSGSGVDAVTMAPGLFDHANPSVLASMDALVIDGQASQAHVENAVYSAALHGTPRLLRIAGGKDEAITWSQRFGELRKTRPRDAFGATVLTAEAAQWLVGPNETAWPPTSGMARVLTWQCCSKFVAIEDADHNCWRLLMPNGKMQRFMLGPGAPFDSVPDLALAALTLQRVVSRSWQVRSMKRWAAAI